jgi:short-subunit dehydrogenase
MARSLAAAGCNLLLTARREERLRALSEELVEANGVEAHVLVEDLSRPGGGGRLFDAVQALDRPVDLLVNNAGFGHDGAFQATDWAREAQMIQLNVVSLVELTKLVLPAMLERGEGDILLVSSIGAFLPVPTFAVYGATKAFVTSFGQALAWELRKTGVNVTVLHPGGTVTEFSEVAGMTPTRLTQLGSMPAEKVARIGLRAMARGRRSVVAGRANGVMMWLTRFLPLSLRLWAAATFQKAAGGGK